MFTTVFVTDPISLLRAHMDNYVIWLAEGSLSMLVISLFDVYIVVKKVGMKRHNSKLVTTELVP